MVDPGNILFVYLAIGFLLASIVRIWDGPLLLFSWLMLTFGWPIFLLLLFFLGCCRVLMSVEI